MQFNIISVSSVHCDSNNVGLALIFLLGQFGGGAFHMADKSLELEVARKSLAIDVHKPQYSEPF